MYINIVKHDNSEKVLNVDNTSWTFSNKGATYLHCVGSSGQVTVVEGEQ